MNFETQIKQALARGYCTPENSMKELDSTLIEAMAIEILKSIGVMPEGMTLEDKQIADGGKMKHIKYRMYGSECLTLCPYISDRSVNSNECSDCRYNGGIKQTRNKETKIIESFVICYFEDKEGK